MMICRAFVLLAVVSVATSFFAISYNDHGHNYTCTAIGFYTDPADKCKGFHACGYDIFTNQFYHKFYLECFGTTLYNGFLCVPPQLYTCPA